MTPLLSWTGALLLAAIFAHAAFSKFAAWDEFAGVVHNFRILPSGSSRIFARALPILEAGAALALLVPWSRSVGALTALALLLSFALAIAINLHRGRKHIDCGCFRNNVAQPLSIWMVARNLTLAAAALSVALDASTTGLSAPGWVVAIASAATLFLLYLCINPITVPLPLTYEENFHASRNDA